MAVVVGSTHHGAIGRVLAGDVAAGLMHDTPCPVAVAPRGYDSANGPLRIGVAYDGSPESDAALAAAVGIARHTGGGVHAFTVLEPPDWAPLYATPGWVPSPSYERRREETAQTVADHALESLPAGLQGVAELLNGPIVQALAGRLGAARPARLRVARLRIAPHRRERQRGARAGAPGRVPAARHPAVPDDRDPRPVGRTRRRPGRLSMARPARPAGASRGAPAGGLRRRAERRGARDTAPGGGRRPCAPATRGTATTPPSARARRAGARGRPGRRP